MPLDSDTVAVHEAEAVKRTSALPPSSSMTGEGTAVVPVNVIAGADMPGSDEDTSLSEHDCVAVIINETAIMHDSMVSNLSCVFRVCCRGGVIYWYSSGYK